MSYIGANALQMVDAIEKAQDVKLEELQRVRQLNLFLRSRLSSLDERLKRKVGAENISNDVAKAHDVQGSLQCPWLMSRFSMAHVLDLGPERTVAELPGRWACLQPDSPMHRIKVIKHDLQCSKRP